MKLIPHHQGDKHGHREYRSPDGTWKVVRTRRSGGNRNERPRWEVHERHERHADWHCHAAFERGQALLVLLPLFGSELELNLAVGIFLPRSHASENFSIPSGANTKSTSNGPLLWNCTKSRPVLISSFCCWVSLNPMCSRERITFALLSPLWSRKMSASWVVSANPWTMAALLPM